jgi:hypothetical protein
VRCERENVRASTHTSPTRQIGLDQHGTVRVRVDARYYRPSEVRVVDCVRELKLYTPTMCVCRTGRDVARQPGQGAERARVEAQRDVRCAHVGVH